MLAKNPAEIGYASNEIGYATTATGSLEGSSPALYARLVLTPENWAGSLKDRLVWTPKKKEGAWKCLERDWTGSHYRRNPPSDLGGPSSALGP